MRRRRGVKATTPTNQNDQSGTTSDDIAKTATTFAPEALADPAPNRPVL